MKELSQRINNLDISLFEAISSQTSPDDRRSLLLLQRCVRKCNDYVYLEIGSHLGGTIQQYYIDPLCRLIYSIDKRPLWQPDERGIDYEYTNNSTERMLENLRNAFPKNNANKIINIDCDAREIDPVIIAEKPNICFIDGEHTNEAVFSDFMFCIKVSLPHAIIAFHDAGVIFKGIKKIKNYLQNNSINFQGFILGGSVYVILLNEAVIDYAGQIKPFAQNESDYFKRALRALWKIRLKNRLRTRHSTLFNILQKGKEALKKHSTPKAMR